MKTKPNKRHYSPGSTTGLIIFTLALAITAALLLNKQSVLDHIAVMQFHPTAEVSQLVDKSGMSNRGEFTYMASTPRIDDRVAFNTECLNQDSTTAVLGCYVDGHIYIFNVTDSRLDGIKSVTAAHEMLHAVYERLSPSKRTQVDAMLEAAYKKLSSQDDLKQRMAIYDKTEPGERDNELHSVLGTEIATLPSDLETYYEQYFSDRAKVVQTHAKYNAVFTKLQNEAKNIQAKMKKLQTTIESSSTNYTRAVATLNADINSFNDRAGNGSFSSQSQFENERSSLENRASSLESERQAINNSIQRYNQLDAKLAEIAAQDKSLNHSINSNLPVAPTLK